MGFFHQVFMGVVLLASVSGKASVSPTHTEMEREEWEGILRNDPPVCAVKLESQKLFQDAHDPSMKKTINTWCRMRDENKEPYQGYLDCRNILTKNIKTQTIQNLSTPSLNECACEILSACSGPVC